MTKRRVVITGLGIVSPLGVGIEANWSSIIAGQGGIGPITRFDATGIACTIAGEANDFDVSHWLSPKEARKMDRFIQFGMAVGIDAFRDCGIEVSSDNAPRIGVNIGTGIGGVETIAKTTQTYQDQGQLGVKAADHPFSPRPAGR